VRPFVEAMRAEGLRVGFYYSGADWYHPDYPDP
jgi:alpha-L-fucosidase